MESESAENESIRKYLRQWLPDNCGLMMEYAPNADFQKCLERLFRCLALCFYGFIAFWLICACFPSFQEGLFAFFRWVLIPVKPFLLAAPSAGTTLAEFLAPVCNAVLFLLAPAIAIFAINANRISYLCIEGGKLCLVELLGGSSDGPSALRIGGKCYRLQKAVSLSSCTRISVERTGKKSCRDYILHFSPEGQEQSKGDGAAVLSGLFRRLPELEAITSKGRPGMSRELTIRWGDIIRTEDRNRFLKFLEDEFPHAVESAMFEPFRLAPERQSYTELWLKELSGAPRRDRLTPLAAGAKLDGKNYRILSKVGIGGQGTVYLADSPKHAATGHERVILKEFVLPVYPDLRIRQKAAERFQAEASMLSRLNHPRIAEFLDLFVEDHRAYLVLEHVEGTTLKELVASKGALEEKQVIELSMQIAEILVYLHSRIPPVIHRDLAPDNIMLGGNGLRLIDFSVAQEFAAGVTGSVVGKPNYISPEQFRGKPTEQSDIYSLGATMSYLLTGHDPPPITVLHPRADSERISAGFDEIIAHCTELETSKRYESAGQVLRDLKSLLPDSAVPDSAAADSAAADSAAADSAAADSAAVDSAAVDAVKQNEC